MASIIKENSTNQENRKILIDKCGVNEVLSFIGKRWLMSILYEISLGNNQFTLLKNNISGISDHILAVRINDLVDNYLIQKSEVENTIPLKITYNITVKGKQLLCLVDGLNNWNTKWKD